MADFSAILKQMALRRKACHASPNGREGKIPLIGIGGLTLERVRAVLEAGADSAAVVTDITRHADPERRARDW